MLALEIIQRRIDERRGQLKSTRDQESMRKLSFLIVELESLHNEIAREEERAANAGL